MHPDLSAEQAYFDRALEHRENARAKLERAPDLAADRQAAAELRKYLGAIALADPDEGVAFGRIDRPENERYYIGKNGVWDEHGDLLVINWQTPAAAPFYQATPIDPHGLTGRRTFRCKGNRILDIDELVFLGLAEVVGGRPPDGPTLDDALLDSLTRTRSGELADIVATIQAAQYEVVSRDMRQLLVVQGAPGTGKTVIGLHRVSWLLYNMRDQLQPNDVLIVGPNPAFIRYISMVLPSLGDEAVVQQAVTSLGPRVRTGRLESVQVRRLKGDGRMAQVIHRALRNRERVDEEPVDLVVDGHRVTIDGGMIASRAAQLARRPHNEIYAELRNFVIRLVQVELSRSGVRDLAALEVAARGASARDIDNYLDRVWPNLTPQAFLLELFSTRRQLMAAAEGVLSHDEIDVLLIPRDAKVGTWEWSADDIALLDAADLLLSGSPHTYTYIVLDEAQDLSPMQLLSIARRSRTGWMTVLGDLAQGTSPWAHTTWADVADPLQRSEVPGHVDQLTIGYRLPAEVHDVAMRLLDVIAQGLATPLAVRSTGHDILVRRATTDSLVGEVVAIVRDLLGTGLIGVITPEVLRDRVTEALDAEGLTWAPELRAAAAPIVVLGAEQAKGIEFDNVVVVEPAGIVDEYERGLQALFIALTRCTRRLALVHVAELPQELGLLPGSPTAADADVVGVADVDAIESTAGAKSNGSTLEPVGGNGDGAAPVDADVGRVGAETGAASGATEVEREIARAVAAALVRYTTQCVQSDLIPLVIHEMRQQVSEPPPD